MASTNQTTNYGLPIYSTGDRASWSDTNQPFEAIDTAVKKAVDDSADAISSVATVTETANTALGTATTAAADASSALTGLDAKQDKTDNNLNTTAKTVVGAINELDSEVAGKQEATDNNLTTSDKTVVGAINEIAGEVANKQNSTDNNLVTTAKTIVGAINELANEIPRTESVEVTADGTSNFTTLLNNLFALVDATKLKKDSALLYIEGATTSYYQMIRTTTNLYMFGFAFITGVGQYSSGRIDITPSASVYFGDGGDYSASVPAAGLKLKVVY